VGKRALLAAGAALPGALLRNKHTAQGASAGHSTLQGARFITSEYNNNIII